MDHLTWQIELGKARSLIAAEQDDAAEPLLLDLLDVDRDHGEPWRLLGRIYDRRKAAGPALEAWREHARIEPKRLEAVVKIARNLRRLDREDEALAAYESVLEIDPEHAEACRHVGRAAFKSGDHERAARCLSVACRARPDDDKLALLAAKAAYRCERFEEALAVLDGRAAGDAAGSGVLQYRARALSKLRRWDEARAAWRAVRLDDCRRYEAVQQECRALLKLGCVEEAAEIYDEACSEPAASLEAHTRLARTASFLDRLDEAMAHAARARALAPNDEATLRLVAELARAKGALGTLSACLQGLPARSEQEEHLLAAANAALVFAGACPERPEARNPIFPHDILKRVFELERQTATNGSTSGVVVFAEHLSDGTNALLDALTTITVPITVWLPRSSRLRAGHELDRQLPGVALKMLPQRPAEENPCAPLLEGLGPALELFDRDIVEAIANGDAALRETAPHAVIVCAGAHPGLAVAAVARGVSRVLIEAAELEARGQMRCVWDALAEQPAVRLYREGDEEARCAAYLLGHPVEALPVAVARRSHDVGELLWRAKDLRASLEIPNEHCVIGCLIPLRDEFEPMRWIETAALIARGQDEVSFVMAGEGHSRLRLMTEIDRLGLEHRLAVPFRGDHPQAWLACFDILLLSCATPEAARLAAEAQRAGLPVVAPRSGSLLEVIEDGRSGIAVEGASAQALADGVAVLLADPARRRAMAEAARERARSAASSRHFEARCLALLDLPEDSATAADG